MPNDAPIYSLDASALIWMKDEYQYRASYFRRLWDFLGRLGDEGRVRVAEQARDECHDEVFNGWFAAHPNLVVPWSVELNRYVNAMNSELQSAGLRLVDDQATKNQADPFVLAVALMLEERPLHDLRSQGNRRCCIVSSERRMMERGLAKIPRVCQHYGLVRMEWTDVIVQEGWEG